MPSSSTSTRHDFLKLVTCPNCWHEFQPAGSVYVSKHESLLGDPVVGENAQMRFMPTRFSPNHQAIDPGGLNCHQLACPRCHLEIARASLDYKPAFLSIVGAPASGKSFLLGSMTWNLRKMMPRLRMQFTDADPSLNQVVHSYEQTLFLAENPDQPVSIQKTEIDGGDLYRSVQIAMHELRLPRPFLFTIDSMTQEQAEEDEEGRLLVLYDNAGEHFLPGADHTRAPVTEHLVRSSAILYVFDPTQDPRLRRDCNENDPQVHHATQQTNARSAVRQETILAETAARIRKHLGTSSKKLHDRPLIVVLAKADAWIHNIPEVDLDTEPFTDDGTGKTTLDVERVTHASNACKRYLEEHCPELVGVATGFCREIHFIPVSAIGCCPELVEDGDTQFYGIRPDRIEPKWVSVPLLFALQDVIKEIKA